MQMPSLRDALHPRLLMVFIFGLCSGFPWVLHGSAMSGWLADSGTSRTAIGLFGAVALTYSLSVIWAPLVDRFALPLPGGRGQRISWICTMLALVVALGWAMSALDPRTQLWHLALLALLMALASSIMDIAIDAYRVDNLPQNLVPLGAAAATGGWWTGFSLVGSLAFYLSGSESAWPLALRTLCAIGLGVCVLIWLAAPKEAAIDRRSLYQEQLRAHGGAFWGHIYSTMILPFADLVRRQGPVLLALLALFLLSFKIGEAFLGRMSIVFYREMGYSNEQIAIYSKLINWFVTILFSVLAALVNIRLGVVRGLFVGGLAMAATNLLFAAIALTGPSVPMLAVAVVLDGFTSALSTVMLVSFITHLTNKTFSATQYTMLAAISTLGRNLLASGSGMVVDGMGGDWAAFFVLTCLMVVPSLVILRIMARRLPQG